MVQRVLVLPSGKTHLENQLGQIGPIKGLNFFSRFNLLPSINDSRKTTEVAVKLFDPGDEVLDGHFTRLPQCTVDEDPLLLRCVFGEDSQQMKRDKVLK